MSTNEYNENIDPKKAAAEEAAAKAALEALGGFTVDENVTPKKKKKAAATVPAIEEIGKNKYVIEEEKKEQLQSQETGKKKNSTKGTATAAATATKETATATKKEERPSTRRTLVQIMNGEILTKDTVLNNLPFTFFIGFLFIVMIAWGYYAETITKKEIQLEKDLGELNSEFFTLTADYNMQRGRRQIANRLEHTGVKESQTSPKKIRVRKYVFE